MNRRPTIESSRYSAIPGKNKLRLLFGLFFLLFAIPLSALIATVYHRLENEALYQARRQADKMAGRLQSTLQQLIVDEQRRPSAEYSFFNVLKNPLLDTTGIKFSPLSEVPPSTPIPGIVGYFQIAPDGSFHIPALPEGEADRDSGLSSAELQNRLTLKRQLQRLLARETNQPATGQNAARQTQAQAESGPYLIEAREEESESIPASRTSTRRKTTQLAKQEDSDKRGFNPFQSRKERVQIPNQTMASDFFQRAPQPVVAESLRQKATEPTAGQNEPSEAIEILSFESEISPLRLRRVKQDYFCFYRHVWQDNQRYTQGFLVEIETFFTALANPVFKDGAFTSVALTEREQELTRSRFYASPEEMMLYTDSLAPPFESYELQIYRAPLGPGQETRLVDLLAAGIGLTLIGGLSILYRLLVRQIELSKQQRNFISAVSHELKTPLTSIRLYGEMLRSGWVNDAAKKQQYYDFIFSESERLSRLVANVLHLARIGNASHPPELSTISATQLLRSIPAKIDAPVKAAGFGLNLIEADTRDRAFAIRVDEDAFFQILINLVDNAMKFAATAEPKIIDIGFRLTEQRTALEFYVRDYGPGIARQEQREIFRLFYRPGDELTRATPGTGIGLALVAQLARSMRARIGVVDRRPGAEFQIRFDALSLSEHRLSP